MEDYLLDRETLGRFVDEFIKKKALPVDNTEELERMREEGIKALDDKISANLFNSLSTEQLTELEQLLDDESAPPDAFKNFFASKNIDVDKIITDSVQAFGKDFLGGEQNA